MVNPEVFSKQGEIVGSALSCDAFLEQLQLRQGDVSFWDTVLGNINILQRFHLVDPTQRFGVKSESGNVALDSQGYTIDQLRSNAALARDYATGKENGESIESGYVARQYNIFGERDFIAYLDALANAHAANAIFSREAREVYARVVDEYKRRAEQAMNKAPDLSVSDSKTSIKSRWKAFGAIGVGSAILAACGAQAFPTEQAPTTEVSPKPAETAVIPTKVSPEAATHATEIEGGGSFVVLVGTEFATSAPEELMARLNDDAVKRLPMVDADKLIYGYMGPINDGAAVGTVGGVFVAQDKEGGLYVISRVVADSTSPDGARYSPVGGRVFTYKNSDGTLALRYYDPYYGGAELPLFSQSPEGQVSFFVDKDTPIRIQARLTDVTDGIKLASLDTDVPIFSMTTTPEEKYQMRVQYSVATYVDWEKRETWISVVDASTDAFTYARVPMRDDGTLYDTWTENGRILVGDKKENTVKFTQVNLTVVNAAENSDGSELAVTHVQFEPPEIAQLIADGATFRISAEGILTAYDKDGKVVAELLDADNWGWKFAQSEIPVNENSYANQLDIVYESPEQQLQYNGAEIGGQTSVDRSATSHGVHEITMTPDLQAKLSMRALHNILLPEEEDNDANLAAFTKRLAEIQAGNGSCADFARTIPIYDANGSGKPTEMTVVPACGTSPVPAGAVEIKSVNFVTGSWYVWSEELGKNVPNPDYPWYDVAVAGGGGGVLFDPTSGELRVMNGVAFLDDADSANGKAQIARDFEVTLNYLKFFSRGKVFKLSNTQKQLDRALKWFGGMQVK